MNIGVTSLRSAHVSSSTAPRNERTAENSGTRLASCHKVCCKSCRDRIIKVLRLIGGKTRFPENANRQVLREERGCSRRFSFNYTRGVDISPSPLSLSLCDRLQIMLNIERDEKLPFIRRNIFRVL